MVRKDLVKIYSGKGRREAVVLFCHSCMGFSEHLNDGVSPSWSKAGHDVSNCTTKQCPLYPYRLSNKKTPVEVDWL